MADELVKLDDLGAMTPSKYSDEDFDKSASGGGFLPRVQLMTSNSAKCKSGDFSVNHYALIQDQKFDDLGKNVDVLIVDWRPKALETGEAVISVFDPNDDEFARIQERSLNEKDSGCMFGPEYLVWIPSVKRFATFFMGTKSSRREAGAVKARMHKAATLGSQKCKNASYEWFAPECQACSTPFEMPNKSELAEVVEKFRNPPKPEIEGVKENPEEARAR